MYERMVVHAIQHTNHKEFHLRYRTYPSREARDRALEMIQEEQDEPNDNLVPVTMTITAETIEQTKLF